MNNFEDQIEKMEEEVIVFWCKTQLIISAKNLLLERFREDKNDEKVEHNHRKTT